MGNKHEVHFPAIRNGMDYLVTVGEALRAIDKARGMKYAILSLHAATEVLLKAPLAQHDWQLVVLRDEDGNICTEADFRRGEFRSISVTQSIPLLNEKLGISIKRSDQDAIGRLARHRNRLQHFEMTAPVEQVQPLTERVLSFLLDFIHHHLPGNLTRQDAEHVQEQLVDLRNVLRDVESFVNTRMKRLQPKLQEADCVVKCRECDQEAAVVDSWSTITSCLFCHSSWDSEAAADVYADPWGVREYEAGTEGGEVPVLNCPECDLRTFVRDVRLVGEESPVDFCFNCAGVFPSMPVCDNGGCDTPTRDDFCPSCLSLLISKFD
ncbi:hypothetical protein [Streptomyces sp. NPDC006925]|uniref:hypothetical protein n=1 Tax=Streptomyces sp. NPDC006925 TaxID=3364768 RepID=UPI0036760900